MFAGSGGDRMERMTQFMRSLWPLRSGKTRGVEMLALAALARSVALRIGGRFAPRGLRTLALGGAGAVAGSALTGAFGADDERPRRRRRKNVLTASDRADIAFIAGSLGKPAGRDFAMIVAARI